jgi:Endosomal/lysosomal potassium channel TMEM175
MPVRWWFGTGDIAGATAAAGREGSAMGSRPRTTERTLALSDGVFAIALTLLVFSIHLPQLASGDEHELASALLDHRDELLSWLVSFGVIGFLWLRHRALFAAVALYALTLAAVSAVGSVMARDPRWWVAPTVVLAAIPASFVVGGWAPLVWLAVPLGARRARRAS